MGSIFLWTQSSGVPFTSPSHSIFLRFSLLKAWETHWKTEASREAPPCRFLSVTLPIFISTHPAFPPLTTDCLCSSKQRWIIFSGSNLSCQSRTNIAKLAPVFPTCQLYHDNKPLLSRSIFPRVKKPKQNKTEKNRTGVLHCPSLATSPLLYSNGLKTSQYSFLYPLFSTELI